MAEEALGWAVVQAAADRSQGTFGDRLAAVYALGSLAHGGFSPLVSDVDVAVVLHGIAPGDTEAVAALTADVNALPIPLGQRLSVFWGTPGSIASDSGLGPQAGRFPPLDRLDLLRHGVLVSGQDIRPELREPTPEELIVGSATFALHILAGAERRHQIIGAAGTATAGPRTVTKVALFPVRFLYTARTGDIGRNDVAAQAYLSTAPPGPARDLVGAALEWRDRWDDGDELRAERLLAAGAVELYREFADSYAELLAGHPDDLGRRLQEWAASL